MSALDPKRAQLEHEYSTALRDCICGADKHALAHAHELGRMAARRGIGVVELAEIHDHALREVLGSAAPPTEVDQFFAEALSPYEMTHRDFREANERLEEAVRELEAFSYSVSHDLRAPLRTISAFTQALAEDLRYSVNERTRDHLRRVISATARMSDRIDALLELSRIGRTQLGRHRVDLSAVAISVVEELRRRDVTRRLGATIEPNLVAVADGRLIRILFDNLIGNAWKFTVHTPSPHVEVGSDDLEGEQVFFVRDNGAGFAMDRAADRLFTPFQRLHSDREYGGMGIGLATVRRIVDRHGGRIWADSAPNMGATFYFTLPAA